MKNKAKILIVVKKGEDILFRSSDIQEIDLDTDCPISLIVKKIKSTKTKEEYIDNVFKINFKKNINKDDREEVDINHPLINKIMKDSKFFFTGTDKERRICYIVNRSEEKLIINKKSPFYEDNLTIYLKIKEV